MSSLSESDETVVGRIVPGEIVVAATVVRETDVELGDAEVGGLEHAASTGATTALKRRVRRETTRLKLGDESFVIMHSLCSDFMRSPRRTGYVRVM